MDFFKTFLFFLFREERGSGEDSTLIILAVNLRLMHRTILDFRVCVVPAGLSQSPVM